MNNIIGYCPQMSPIDPEYTIKDKLKFLSMLLGMDENQAERYAKLIAKKFDIYQFFNTKIH